MKENILFGIWEWSPPEEMLSKNKNNLVDARHQHCDIMCLNVLVENFSDKQMKKKQKKKKTHSLTKEKVNFLLVVYGSSEPQATWS